MSLARLWLLTVLISAAACSAATPEPAAAPVTPSAATGSQLFRNKGCVTCHRHDRVTGESGLLAVGPDLSPYSNDPEFLRRWLDNPKAIKPDTPMPDFDLTAAEIEDLIAFLNAPR